MSQKEIRLALIIFCEAPIAANSFFLTSLQPPADIRAQTSFCCEKGMGSFADNAAIWAFLII